MFAAKMSLTHMSITLEELYFGYMPLPKRDFKWNSEYAHVLQLTRGNEEKLSEILTKT